MDASLTDISSILQCKVCLRRLRDPKQLYPCHHIFCKECIEGVMRFRPNGSIDIPCPLRCPKRMHLKKDQTISDLGTAYEIKAIIETLEKRDSSLEGRVLGCKTGGCQRDVSMHCCGQKLCSECYKKHTALSLTLTCSLAQLIGVDDDSGQMVAICRVHSIKCLHVCRTCSSGEYACFVCMYCLNRDHKQHTVETVDDCTSKVKESLKENYANSLMLDQVKEATEKTVELCKLKLDKLLQQRKRECISKYIDHIVAEEEKIKEEFKQRSEEHLRWLPTSETHSKLFEEKLSEDGLSLILDKSTLLNDFSHASYTERLSVSYSSSNDFHSLGTLKLNSRVIPLSSISAAALSTLEDNIAISEVKNEDLVSTLTYKWEELLKPDCKSQTDSQQALLEDVRNVDKQGFSFLEDLIESNEVVRLASLLAAKPELLDMRGNSLKLYGYTIGHHIALAGSEECAKLLFTNYPCLVELPAEFGNTPLHIAARHGRWKIIEILRSSGASWDVINAHGRTPSDEAFGFGHTALAKAL